MITSIPGAATNNNIVLYEEELTSSFKSIAIAVDKTNVLVGSAIANPIPMVTA